MSSKTLRLLAAFTIAMLAVTGCKHEKTNSESEAFAFVVYPGSRYLAHVTDLFKQAHKVLDPANEAPPTAVYDTEAPLDKVAEFYAKSYGYNTVAPDATNNLSSAKPAAYYRSGDLAIDLQQVQPTLDKLNLHPDASRAVGHYKAAEIAGKSNRPRITLQRPYFDVTTSQVVDRTFILMSR